MHKEFKKSNKDLHLDFPHQKYKESFAPCFLFEYLHLKTTPGFLSTDQFLVFFVSFSPLSHRQPFAASAPVSIVTLSPTLARHNQVNGMGVEVGAGGERGNCEQGAGVRG